MNLEALKSRVTARRHQLVLLDRAGLLLESCDSLVPLQHLVGEPLLESFQLFEGLVPTILSLQPGEAGLHLPLIGFIFEDKPYRLTLEFWAEPDVEAILWLLSTEDIPSEKLRQIQQDRNETYIGLEKVTEQEQTLREYTERLEQAHQNLQRFAFVVSHDLKAPLRAIGNLAIWIGEAIEGNALHELPEYLGLLRNRVQRMEGLVEGILQYHRAGRERRELELVDLRAMLHELHETIFAALPCTLTIDPSLPVLFCCRTAMYQIFSNLFSNVLKYGRGAECGVEIKYEEMPHYYKLGVRDHGPGIDPRHHERIFEIFQTLQSKDDDESSGIGLSIVRRIAEEAGGTAWVESQLGHGATFWFTWPKEMRN
jgi:signal transduction histidine kinase